MEIVSIVKIFLFTKTWLHTFDEAKCTHRVHHVPSETNLQLKAAHFCVSLYLSLPLPTFPNTVQVHQRVQPSLGAHLCGSLLGHRPTSHRLAIIIFVIFLTIWVAYMPIPRYMRYHSLTWLSMTTWTLATLLFPKVHLGWLISHQLYNYCNAEQIWSRI